ncbi:MAG: flagellum-specific ATP synthase FliI, partial [Tepidimonas fonticaldi]|nr:flagellum-specific ATP synthase FliI [Tepidimonas fonticaldi]
YSRYQKSRDLIQLGAYVPGSDPETDLAIQLQPAMQGLLMQDMRECAPFQESVQRLAEVLQPATARSGRDAMGGRA